MKCRVCSRQINDYELIKNINVEVTNVYTSLTKGNKTAVHFFHCVNCGHSMIESVLKESHYTNYNVLKINQGNASVGGGNASLLKGYYLEVLKDLSLKAIDNKKILDIGCGTGEILKYASKYFDECKGIDPSEPECAIARSRGCNVKNGFFNDEFYEEGFSAFVCMQVLEHLEDLKSVIKNMYRILKSGGVGYIDVPNGQQIYRKSRYYDIYAEHINYFSISSLSRLVADVGFDIASTKEVLHGNHIGIFVRKSNLHKEFEQVKRCAIKKIVDYINEYNKVSIWGAGIKGRCFLQELSTQEQKKIRYLFDSNNAINNCYIANFIIPIEFPNSKKIQENDLIIITAIEYKDQIISDLKSKYDYKGKVACIDEEETI